MTVLAWIDLETTGLSPENDRILEVALAFAPLHDPFNVEHVYRDVAFFPPHPDRCPRDQPTYGLVASKAWGELDPFIVEMHTKNGLFNECSTSVKWTPELESDLLDLIPHVEDKNERVVLAGSSIHFDHAFLNVHMPTLAKRLSHRHYDVSALKLFCESQGMPRFKKGEAHRAKDDIDESVAHGAACKQWLKENL